jgi:hypothetical protein
MGPVHGDLERVGHLEDNTERPLALLVKRRPDLVDIKLD